MAKTLLVKTRNGSAVIAKIAGIESTAKMRSVNSTMTRARKSGVARRTPGRAASTTRSVSSAAPGTGAWCEAADPARTKKCGPWNRSVIGKSRRVRRTTTLRLGSVSSAFRKSILIPVRIRKAAEDVDDPGEALDELRAHRDHRAPHHQGAQDAPEEHAVLVDLRDGEEAEEHRDDEDVVDGQRLLDQVARDVLDQGAGAVVVDGAHPLDRLGRDGHHVGRQPEPEPVVLVARVDEAGEGEAEGDPEGGPAERLLDRHDVRLPVEDAEVEGQQGEHERDEAGVHPDHVYSIGQRIESAKAMPEPRSEGVRSRWRTPRIPQGYRARGFASGPGPGGAPRGDKRHRQPPVPAKNEKALAGRSRRGPRGR